MPTLNYHPDREEIARSGARYFGNAAQFKLLPGSNEIDQEFVDFLESTKEEEPYKTWWRNTVLQYSQEKIETPVVKDEIPFVTEADEKPTRKAKTA